jgi:hypothetical protein
VPTFKAACFDYWRQEGLDPNAVRIDLQLVGWYAMPLIGWLEATRIEEAHLEVFSWLLEHHQHLDAMTHRRVMLATERIVKHAKTGRDPWDDAA